MLGQSSVLTVLGLCTQSLSSAPIGFVGGSLAPTSVSCSIERHNQQPGNTRLETVYVGSAADPFCRDYHPDLGFDDVNGDVWALMGYQTGQDGSVTGGITAVLEYHPNPRSVTGTDFDLYTVVDAYFDYAFPLRATFPGTGRAQLGVGPLEQHGNFNSFPGIEFPVFDLGEESTVAVALFRVGVQLSDSTPYGPQPLITVITWCNIIELRQVPDELVIPIPEPATLLLTLCCLGMGGTLVNRVKAYT
jgi:hypothetical protein